MVEEYVMGETTEGERKKKSITIYPRWGVEIARKGKRTERYGMERTWARAFFGMWVEIGIWD